MPITLLLASSTLLTLECVQTHAIISVSGGQVCDQLPGHVGNGDDLGHLTSPGVTHGQVEDLCVSFQLFPGFLQGTPYVVFPARVTVVEVRWSVLVSSGFDLQLKERKSETGI